VRTILIAAFCLFAWGQTAAQVPTTPPSPPATSPPIAPASGVRLTFGDQGNVVRLTGTGGEFTLTVAGLGSAIDGLSGKALTDFAATIRIVYEGRPEGRPAATVTPGTPRFFGRLAGGGLSWLVPLTTDGAPAGWTEPRALSFTLGASGQEQFYGLSYVLTTLPAATAQFDVLTPGHDWMVSLSDAAAERTYPITITNKAEPVLGLRLVQSSLKRTDDTAALAFDRLRLLADPAAKTGGRIDLRPNETKTVFLRLDPSDAVGPFGTFSGQIQLASDTSAPKPVALTAKVSSAPVRLFGVVLVLLGLGLSLFVSNRLKPIMLRLQALRPVAILRELLDHFADDASARGGDDVRGIVDEARRQADRLQEGALDAEGLLPTLLTLAGGGVREASQLQRRLDEIGARFAGLTVLRDAILQLASKHQKTGRLPVVTEAIDNLNAFASSAATEAAAQTQVTSVQATLKAAADAAKEAVRSGLEAAGLESLLGLESTLGSKTLSVSQLDFALRATTDLTSLIWAAISLAIGATYIYADVDFGTAVDLLGMLLWGLGVTTFGAGMQQLTPSSVASHVGLTVPKPSTQS
jgi:hypothetical protein